jgi:hypothetical protein
MVHDKRMNGTRQDDEIWRDEMTWVEKAAQEDEWYTKRCENKNDVNTPISKDHCSE